MISHKYIPAAALLLAVAAAAQMDGSLGGYSAMEIEAGRMKGNFATGVIDEMTDGVSIRLLSDTPGLAPLPIKAGTMKFTWVEGRTTPSTILMEKNVKVAHPDAEVSAGRAEWNFDSGELVFSENPVVNSERLKGLRGERMILNLKTNTFEVTRVRADEVPLQGMEAAAPRSPDEIRAADIKNWERLVDTIKSEAVGEQPSPGKQILNQLTPQNQQLLLQLGTAQLVDRKEDILRLMNNALANPGFYDARAWANVTLPEEAANLLAAGPLDRAGQARLNRLLIEAAYPFAFSNE